MKRRERTRREEIISSRLDQTFTPDCFFHDIGIDDVVVVPANNNGGIATRRKEVSYSDSENREPPASAHHKLVEYHTHGRGILENMPPKGQTLCRQRPP